MTDDEDMTFENWEALEDVYEEMLDEEETPASFSSAADRVECDDEEECLEFLEKMVWENRTVVPAFQGISSRSLKVGI